MGYLCPVCEEPFGGETAVTHHLAVTAIVHGEEHEVWLNRTFDDWESLERTALADAVSDVAEPTDDDFDHPSSDHSGVDYFESPDSGFDRDATADGNRSEIELNRSGDTAARPGVDAELAALDADGQRILREARALTQAMAATGARHPQPAQKDTVKQPDGKRNDENDDARANADATAGDHSEPATEINATGDTDATGGTDATNDTRTHSERDTGST